MKRMLNILSFLINIRKNDNTVWNSPKLALRLFCAVVILRFTQGRTRTYPVEVDDHGPVAHLGRFVVRVPDSGECHLGAARTHGDPERRASGVRGRVGIAHNEALPLQDDWFRLVLSACQARCEPYGTQQGEGQHTGPQQ